MMSGGAERVAAAVRSGPAAGSIRGDVDAGTLGQMLTILAFGVLTAIDPGVPVDVASARDSRLRLFAPPATARG